MTATTPITSFTGEYRFLSNFYPCRVLLDGVDYPTVEHAYQAAKIIGETRMDTRLVIRSAPSPGTAKRMGRFVPIRPDWEEVKLGIMTELLRQKFADPMFKAKLYGTGDAELIEGNPWHDTYWGVCDGVGENHLGKLLMRIREQIKSWR